MFSLNFWNLPALSRTRRTQPFNYNSCVTKFKTKLQKVTRTIMKPKVPCIMLSFYRAACHLIIARSQSFCTTLLPGTLVHFVVGTAQSVSWLSFLLWVMDSSPEPGTSSFFCQYEEEEEAMRKALEESLLDSRQVIEFTVTCFTLIKEPKKWK